MSKPSEKNPNGIYLREHTYDGIQEYDQRLPNWWLFTLYGAILFSVIYWFFHFQSGMADTDVQQLEVALNTIETTKLQNSIDVTNDSLFFEMSENTAFVQAGMSTYAQSCLACHGDKLQGGIGENLVDATWKHGSNPTAIYKTIYDGVPEKGMQAWGNLLGQKKIVELVAYILSKQGS